MFQSMDMGVYIWGQWLVMLALLKTLKFYNKYLKKYYDTGIQPL